jgi:hypothetical protein
MGLLGLTRQAVVVWITFLYMVGGLAFGGTLGERYLSVTRLLWTTHRGLYRPLWTQPEGRSVLIELFGGWFLATLAGWKLGQSILSLRPLFGFPHEESWIIGVCLGVQFGLWSGVTLMWPVYRWLRDLPHRP